MILKNVFVIFFHHKNMHNCTTSKIQPERQLKPSKSCCTVYFVVIKVFFPLSIWLLLLCTTSKVNVVWLNNFGEQIPVGIRLFEFKSLYKFLSFLNAFTLKGSIEDVFVPTCNKFGLWT